jgi:ABC-type uncharacterized transport system substrate-binding protein
MSGMDRRGLIVLLGGAAAAWPLGAHAQQSRIPVFGILLVFSRESGRAFIEPLRAYMQALGYVEGRNIAFEVRYADGQVDRLPTLAADLVAQRPAVIATFGDATALAVKAATNTIPIVSMSEDLVRAKIVTNIRQPGGNVTGVSIMGTELDAKRLEMLAELLPARSIVLLLADPTTHRESRPALNATAAALGSRCARPLQGHRSRSSGPCGRPGTTAPRASTYCPRRCCSRCEGASSTLQWSLACLRCINGRKRRMRAA